MDQATGRLSPLLKSRRIQAVVPHLVGSVLDFGCGDGAIANVVPPHRYHGVDISQAYIDTARRQHPEHTFTRDLPSGRFDTFAAVAVIEHLPDPDVLFNAAKAVEASRVVLTTPKPSLEWTHHLGARLGYFPPRLMTSTSLISTRGQFGILRALTKCMLRHIVSSCSGRINSQSSRDSSQLRSSGFGFNQGRLPPLCYGSVV